MTNEIVRFVLFLQKSELLIKKANVQKILEDYEVDVLKERLNVNGIIEAVCNRYGLPVALITKVSKRRVYSEPRMVAMNLLNSHTKLNLRQIGAMFRNEAGHVFDHATVLHAVDTISDFRETNKEFEKDYKELEQEVVELLKRQNEHHRD